ncbi:hypothetical protein B7494_g4488 [Chlorociboria aeruginascens]|nr:hypothetical protein B7494_g4488 [Chlorociboria aeruginascens]
MPGTISDGPSVAMSFANNFWGKDDAGVEPLLQRMHNAKQTCDELKSFYTARSAIEDEYARKLLSLSRKPLGSQESGTLRASLDVMRGEVEQMGKSHQNIAGQMKTELEEPLAAFAGAMKERRKIVQGGIEKLLKVKIQQTQQVNKTRDKYEQECLKIKGYLAQGHMVMGQEERKNKAKLEKTQINLATSNTEYENAVKILEETTGRWNRDWKAAADKFQDLEEERLDFTKSSLWSFANIASTVCVSDDASCEKVRLSLENCEVEKDISGFIKERGTGQEIPDPPKYINFCRGDVSDTQSESSEDDTYSVAQFQRTINPAYRTSSPQPSTYESHHEPQSNLARDLGHEAETPPSREATLTPQKVLADRSRQPQLEYQVQAQKNNRLAYDQSQHGQLAAVPHDPYPMDGMTMLCRTGPPSERSSAHSQARPCSRDSQSEYSNPTSFSSQEPPSGKTSPIKQNVMPQGDKQVQKKKSGFFQSPFRRKSNKEKDSSTIMTPSNRNTWSARNTSQQDTPSRRPMYTQDAKSQNMLIADRQTGSPEPVDPRASFQLNVGNNVFDVATPDRMSKTAQNSPNQPEDLDPIAQALAELKGVTKASSSRMSADNYHGIRTPAPGATPNSRPGGAQMANGSVMSGMPGTPPPSYDQPMQRLGLPQPAFTSKAMQQTRQKYVDQTQTMFNNQGRPDSQGGGSQPRSGTRGSDMPRAASPAPSRSASPRPGMQVDTRQGYRSASPNPYGGSQRGHPSPEKRGSDQGYYRYNSPNAVARAVSPAPFREHERPGSSHVSNDMSIQLAPGPDDGYGSQKGRSGRASSNARPISYYNGQGGQQIQASSRQRSKSVADARQFNRDGRPILHFARALYVYQAAIPEELSFAKGDILADIVLKPVRIAISKPARQTYLNTILFLTTSTILLGLAIIAYIIFYYNYVPQMGIQRVIHLQYGDGPHPYGLALLDSTLISQQPYDISLTITLPLSPTNLETGNFMLSLSLLSPSYTPPAPKTAPPTTLTPSLSSTLSPETILFTTRRPVLLTYTSPLISFSSRLLSLPLYILGLRSESETLVIPMSEKTSFPKGWKNIPAYILLELQTGQEIQVYDVKVRITARFAGLRWVMWNHRILAFFVFTGLFWGAEVLFAVLGWVGGRMLFGHSISRSEAKGTVEIEEGERIRTEEKVDEDDDPDLSDTPRTFPTYGRQKPLRYEPKAKEEEKSEFMMDEAMLQPLAVEADDEDESEELERGRIVDSGIGTSFSEGGERSGLVRRRSKGKGR